VRNGHQVLDHLLLRAQRLGVHHDQLTLMTTAEMGKEIKAEAHQSICMSNHDHADLIGNNAINERQKLGALKVESPTNLTDPLCDGEATRSTKLL
jgi:hypothetical protein